MSRRRQCNAQSIRRQRGAVAIIVGICIALLLGMLGLVLDLGHLYVAKTELQNAADAAALSGAKELNGSLDGVNNAKDRAIEAAGLNSYDLNHATPVTLDVGNLQFSKSAYGPWESFADAQASPDGKTFLKVDTGLQDFNTWFIHVLGATSTMRTFGMAVAGPYTVNITPMGVCAVDPAAAGREYAFIRGVAYNIPNLNPLGVQPDQIWINPIDIYPGDCKMSNAAPATTYPYICTGSAASIIPALPGRVYYDTGRQATLEGPLNSRFGDLTSYTGGHACDPLTAPADINIQEYRCTNNGNPDKCGQTAATNLPKDWMDPTTTTIPTSQSIEIRSKTDPLYPRKPFNYPVRTSPETNTNFSRYGVLWSYSREINFGTSPPTLYNATDSDWTTLYGGKPNNYPEPSPYKQLTRPPTGPGAAGAYEDRRVLNMLIMDCDPAKVEKVGECKALPVLAVGRFFMQRRASLPDDLHGEFAGILAPSLLEPQIRLYQ